VKKTTAWVITWDWFADTRKPRRLILNILQLHQNASRVLEHMKLLYLNSELFLPSERLQFKDLKAWHGLIFQEGPRILIGDDPILVGSFVNDLRIERLSDGEEIVRWTQPPGVRSGPAGTAVPMGKPTERALRISIRGQVTQV
jgi:hypothetical protein